jgi:hypothetical protein
VTARWSVTALVAHVPVLIKFCVEIEKGVEVSKVVDRHDDVSRVVSFCDSHEKSSTGLKSN